MVITALYYALPGLIANMMPVFGRGRLKFLAIPVDLGKTFRRQPLFGSHKTYRGFVFGIAGASIVAYLQTLAYNNSLMLQYSYIDYSIVNPLYIGAIMGFGALFGDLVKSFFKRRLKFRPGNPWIPWDQLDFIIGIIIFSAIIRPMTPLMILTLVLIGPLLHIAATKIGFFLKIRKRKW